MSIKSIIHDRFILSKKSVPATKKDLHTALDLRDTLIAHRNEAAGLAANMIGENVRIIAFYVGPLAMVMINPLIIAKSGEYLAEEGCLSWAGLHTAKRHRKIKVSYKDLQFNNQKQEFEGEIAEVIEHEIDHFAGKEI